MPQWQILLGVFVVSGLQTLVIVMGGFFCWYGWQRLVLKRTKQEVFNALINKIS